MKVRQFAILGALMLGAALATPVGAAEQRPMSGQFTAQAGPAATRCGPDALTLGFEIEGVATHLGSLTGTGSNCTEFGLTTSAVAIWDGITTFVAADGSTLSTTAEGTQDAPIAGRAAFAVTHTIEAGTGRFAGATGLWEVTGVIDFTTGGITGQVAGWLSY